jgi:hypothetical protein
VRSKYNTYIIQYMSTVYNCCLLEEVKRELQSVWCGTRSFCFYESIKREVQRRPIYECWYDERLKTKAEGSTCLAHTGLLGGLEHLDRDEVRFLLKLLFIGNWIKKRRKPRVHRGFKMCENRGFKMLKKITENIQETLRTHTHDTHQPLLSTSEVFFFV